MVNSKKLFYGVLAGSPKANIHLQDAFGTSAYSGVQRMQKEHREQARRRYFGGKPSTDPWNDASNMTPEAQKALGIN